MVPTEVSDEAVTPEPSVVALRTEVPAILNSMLEARSMCSLKVQLFVLLTQLIVLSVAPLRVMPPPSAVVSVGVATEPSSRFLSSTVTVLELTVVVVPETVRLPPTVTLPVVVSAAMVAALWSTVPVNVLLPLMV